VASSQQPAVATNYAWICIQFFASNLSSLAFAAADDDDDALFLSLRCSDFACL